MELLNKYSQYFFFLVKPFSKTALVSCGKEECRKATLKALMVEAAEAAVVVVVAAKAAVAVVV